jgi:hypothetical protein
MASTKKGSTVTKVPELGPVVDPKLLNAKIAELTKLNELEAQAHALTHAKLTTLEAAAKATSVELARWKAESQPALVDLKKRLEVAIAERDAAIAERDTALKRVEELEKAVASSKPTPPPPPPPAAPKPAPAASEITNVVPAADFASVTPAASAAPSLTAQQRVALLHANLIAQRASTQVAQPGPKPPSAQVNVVSKLLAADKSKPLAPAPKDGTLAGVGVAPIVTLDEFRSVLRRLDELETLKTKVESVEVANEVLRTGFEQNSTAIQALHLSVGKTEQSIALIITNLRDLRGKVSAKASSGEPDASAAGGGAAEDGSGGLVLVTDVEIEAAAPATGEAASPAAPATGEAASPAAPATGEAASPAAPATGEAAGPAAPATGEAAGPAAPATVEAAGPAAVEAAGAAVGAKAGVLSA